MATVTLLMCVCLCVFSFFFQWNPREIMCLNDVEKTAAILKQTQNENEKWKERSEKKVHNAMQKGKN